MNRKVINVLMSVGSILYVYCWMIFMFVLLLVLFNGADTYLQEEISGSYFSSNFLKAAMTIVLMVWVQVLNFQELLDKYYNKRLKQYKDLSNNKPYGIKQ